MTFKMKGFSGFKSPLKQDYKVLDDKELEESRNRLNARADAIEQIKNMGNIKGIKAEDYMTKGEKEGIVAINKQLIKKKNQPINPGGNDKWEKAKEKVKK
jgi:hypothetical protein